MRASPWSASTSVSRAPFPSSYLAAPSTASKEQSWELWELWIIYIYIYCTYVLKFLLFALLAGIASKISFLEARSKKISIEGIERIFLKFGKIWDIRFIKRQLLVLSLKVPSWWVTVKGKQRSFEFWSGICSTHPCIVSRATIVKLSLTIVPLAVDATFTVALSSLRYARARFNTRVSRFRA